MVRVTSAGAVMAASDTAPDTVTTSFGSATSSLTKPIVTVPVLSVASAAKLSSWLVLSSKSASVAGATGLAVTVTVNAVAEAGATIAVTVTVPPSRAALFTPLKCSVTCPASGVADTSSEASPYTGSPPAGVSYARTWKVCTCPAARPLTDQPVPFACRGPLSGMAVQLS